MSDALITGLDGAGGGIIAQIINYLLRAVATLQQTERDLKKERRRIRTLEQIFQLVKQEGWERLYGGLLPSLVGTAASQGVCYYFYQIFRKKAELSAIEQRKKGIGNGTVGMLAGRPSQELTHKEKTCGLPRLYLLTDQVRDYR